MSFFCRHLGSEFARPHHIESLNESEGWVDLEKQEGLTLEKIGFNLAIGFEDTLLLPEYGKIVMEHKVKSHT